MARGGKSESTADMGHFNARVEGINYDILDDLVGYAVRRAQISIYEDFAQTLAAEEVTPQRFAALVIIENNPRISQTKLAEVMGIARSGVVSIIDRFEAQGLVERQESDDRRSYCLQLTKEGQKHLKRCKKAVREHDERMSHMLSQSEKKQLIELLQRICQHAGG